MATRKLVDSSEEQILLEEMIEEAKPPYPAGAQLYHYLLHTPFRYPPLPYGSRFATRNEVGVWYGAVELETALAETAYYRLVFLEGSEANLGTLETRHSVFRVKVRTARGVDLTLSPFVEHRDEISSKTDYGASQALGRDMRASRVQAFRYSSARAAEGVNMAVFELEAFMERTPGAVHDWYCVAERARVEFNRLSTLDKELLVFLREDFIVDGVLPVPSA